MAIIGSLVAYVVYQAIAGRAPIASARRIVAGAVAGYVAINVAAFAAGFEFGVQPLLFHDATGAPLYAPYPLSVAIPAMMLAHLTLAGLAEAIITAGIVAYLQRANPSLLQTTAMAANDQESERERIAAAGGWRGTRPLWIGLGVLMVACPLGLLAAGMAWGEWGTDDLQNPEVRQQITQASGNIAPPEHVPAGMERLASIWTAPMPDYAPPFMHDPNFGYIMSAIIGAGLIVLIFVALSWLARARPEVARRGAPEPTGADARAEHGHVRLWAVLLRALVDMTAPSSTGSPAALCAPWTMRSTPTTSPGATGCCKGSIRGSSSRVCWA